MSEKSSVEWLGVLVPRSEYNPGLVKARDRLADSAKAGDWPAVLAVLDGDGAFKPGPNDWRVEGSSWFGPLHQAAWLGASEDVVRALIDRGVWRTLRDADGRRPVEIARERGNSALVDALTPTCQVALTAEGAHSMSRRLATLVEDAVARAVTAPVSIRHLDVECIAERDDSVWFPVPGMYGGFAVELVKHRLHVESWSRVVGGSGRAYVITADRTTLVDEGFV
ncbi:hypothetical protein [Microbacterium sp. P03]|uniref:hypothetical protein n=1 Tax=Microbacterium sp. P03 TaxID=3366946 RepID=UPI0037473886